MITCARIHISYIRLCVRVCVLFTLYIICASVVVRVVKYSVCPQVRAYLCSVSDIICAFV